MNIYSWYLLCSPAARFIQPEAEVKEVKEEVCDVYVLVYQLVNRAQFLVS